MLRQTFLLVIFLMAVSSAQVVLSPEIEKALLEATNAQRVRAGLTRLVAQPSLKKAAQGHSGEMAKLGYFSHRSPTKGRDKVRQRVELASLTPKRVAENIFNCYGYPPDQVAPFCMSSWLESSGHRANILNPKFSHVGFGVAIKGDKYYVTQVFAGGDLNFQKAHVASDSQIQNAEAVAQRVFDLTNQRRRDANLPEFTNDSVLVAAAGNHAQDMLRQNYFGHRSPAGEKVRDRVKKVGAEPYRLAENLYSCNGYKPEAVPLRAMLSWMQSEGHKANILDSRLDKMGVSVYRKGGEYFLVQVFSGGG